jgi:shikimate dehydrogenase
MSMSVPEIFSAGEFLSNPGGFADFDPPVRLGVIGDPIAHSRSPIFHNAALDFCGIPARYARLHVPPESLEAILRAFPEAGFLGANVTIPHKTAALACVDEADSYAKAAGSVNTIVVKEGKLLGFNTDGPGLVRAIREEFNAEVRDLRVLVLGAGGGAGRAIAVQCAMEGCERLVLANRTLEKASELARELTPFFSSEKSTGAGERILAIPFEEEALRRELRHTDLLINATSLGMKPTDPSVVPATALNPDILVYDTVYAGGTSRLLEDAAASGARGANGLGMLLHQGAMSFEIWFNRSAPLEEMRRALHSGL